MHTGDWLAEPALDVALVAEDVVLVPEGESGGVRQPLEELVFAIDERKHDEVLPHVLVAVLHGLHCADVAENLLPEEALQVVPALPALDWQVVVELDGAAAGDEELFGFFLLIAGLDGEEIEREGVLDLRGTEQCLVIQLHYEKYKLN